MAPKPLVRAVATATVRLASIGYAHRHDDGLQGREAFEAARAYGELKRRLAAEHPHDIDAYVAGKTDVVLGLLRAAGLAADELAAIERVNRSQP